MATNKVPHEKNGADSGIHPTAPQPEEKRESELIATARGVDDVELTFTMRELCNAIGHGTDADSFASDALQALAQQIEAEATVSCEEGGRWEQLFSIARRAEFAALVTIKLGHAIGDREVQS